MDLGLGNLIELKRQLLPVALLGDTDYDARITALGRGVASQFERVCNRKFARLVGAVDIFSADRDHWTLTRYPLETITTVELRSDLAAGWVVQTGAIQMQDELAGLISFGQAVGTHRTQYRVTYTGGFWYDTAETEDTAQPAGSTLLPYDLKHAWYLQCQHAWAKMDKQGQSLAGEPEKWSALGDLQIIPDVVNLLNPHRRMMLT